MNNNLLLQAQKWLTEIGIKSEACQTFLKVNRADVRTCGFFDIVDDNGRASAFLIELKAAVSKKLYLDNGDPFNYHINSF